MNTADLYKLAKDENIDIKRMKLKDLNGFYLESDVTATIVLDMQLKNREEKATLAEELGHHFAGTEPNSPFASDYYNTLIRSRNENKALKWCTSNLVDYETKQTLKQAYIDLEEFADELEVPVNFANRIVEYLKNTNFEFSYI